MYLSYIYCLFHSFKESCPLAEAVFSKGSPIKRNYNIKLKRVTSMIKNQNIKPNCSYTLLTIKLKLKLKELTFSRFFKPFREDVLDRFKILTE